jgi:hypothetical protein
LKLARQLLNEQHERVSLLSSVTSLKEAYLLSEIDRMKHELTDRDKQLQKSDS